MKVTLFLLSSVTAALALDCSNCRFGAILLEDHNGPWMLEGQQPPTEQGSSVPQRLNSGQSRSLTPSNDGSLTNTTPPRSQGLQPNIDSAPRPIDSQLVEGAQADFAEVGNEAVTTGGHQLQAKSRAPNPAKSAQGDGPLPPSSLDTQECAFTSKPPSSYVSAGSDQSQLASNIETRSFSNISEQSNESEPLSKDFSTDHKVKLSSHNCDSQSILGESCFAGVSSYSQASETSPSQSSSQVGSCDCSDCSLSSGDDGYGDWNEGCSRTFAYYPPESSSYDSSSQAGSDSTLTGEPCNECECYCGVCEQSFE